MTPCYLCVLGVPNITAQVSGSVAGVRFRYRDTWLLLSSLALDPATIRREALILRLNLDNEQKGRDKLRFRLNDLRHGATSRGKSLQNFCGIGEANVIADGETVVLRPHSVQTDLQEVQAALAQAALLPTPQKKVACLRGASALLRGSFLEGYDLPCPTDGWLEGMRVEADRLSSEVWLQLAHALEEIGERRSAFDAARKAYTLRSENPETLELLLDLADGAREQEEILQLARNLKIEALLPHLEALEREGVPPTVSEENVLREAVKTRLSQLSQNAVVGLKTIAYFPQDFTAAQAEAIGGVTVATLERLVQIFPLSKVGERYYLLPALRSVLRGLLPEDEGEHFDERHAHYFAELLEIGSSSGLEREEFRKMLQGEIGHLEKALVWFQRQPTSYRAVSLILSVWEWLGRLAPIRQILFQSSHYLEMAVENLSGHEAAYAAETLGKFSMAQQNFSQALYWFEITQRSFTQDPNHFYSILRAAHHAAEDTIFDYYADIVVNHWPIGNHLSLNSKRQYLQRIHTQIAENYMARHNFIGALEQNEKAFLLQKELGESDNSSPSLWGQRASTLWGLGRVEECEQCWDRALAGYEAQGNLGGVAECYQEIGRLAARKGQGGLGISLLRQAIVHFGELGNLGAVAAAQGTLGDILLSLGEREKARGLYEQGLAYWQAQKHPRWTERFEERLQRLKEKTREPDGSR